MRGGLIGLCALLSLPFGALADDAVVRTAQTRVELSAERRVAAPGESLWVALSIDLKPKWHTYWRTPGDAGEPIVIKWRLPPGVGAGPIQWPTPERFSVSDIASFGYARHLVLLTELKIAPSVTAPSEFLIRADVAWLICAEICVPEDGSVSLPVKIDTMHRNIAVNTAFTTARASMPAPAPWPVKATRSGDTLTITAGPGIGGRALKSVLYFPYSGDLIVNGAKQQFRLQDGTLELMLELTPDASQHSEAAGVLRFDRENDRMPSGYTFATPIL